MKKAKIIVLVIFFMSVFILQLEAQGTEESTFQTSLRPKEYTAEDLRDPFQGYIKKEEVAPSEVEIKPEPEQPLPILTVQGIIWQGSFPQAIINNKIVKVGDFVDGVEIVSINKEGVKVLFGNKEYNLSSPASSLESLKQ